MQSWFQRLTAKIIGISLVFFALMVVAIAWQYYNLKSYFMESYRKEAALIAENINTSIQTLMLNYDLGGDGALVKHFVEEMNNARGGAVVRLVHSKAVDLEYGVQEDELPQTQDEVDALDHGNQRSFGDREYFTHIMPIKAVEECSKCHTMPDGSGDPIPHGYVLGLAVVKIPKSLMNERLNILLSESVKSVLVTGSLVLFMGFFSRKYIASPLKRMLKVIQRVTHGDLDQRVRGIIQRDEIGMLAENFNVMADQMERSFKRLENWNVELSSEVGRQTEEIRMMRDHYQSVVDSTQRVIYTTDRNFIIDSVNAEWDILAAKYGMNTSRDELIGKNLLDYVDGKEGGERRRIGQYLAGGKEREEFRRIGESIIERGKEAKNEIYRTEFDMSLNGDKKYFGLTVSPLMGSDGAAEGLVFVSYDISERKVAEEMLRVERDKLDAIMGGMGAAVNIVDEDFRIRYMNRIMERIFGASAVGRRCYEVIAGRGDPCENCGVNVAEGSYTTEIMAINGRVYLSTHSPIINMDNTRSIIEVHKDITHLKEMEDKLRKLTITDNLTGLYNKRFFIQKLNDEMVRAQRQRTSLTLLFVDIDGFKNYNDAYGHIEGDLCLAQLGRIIRESIRAHVDNGFRYGGEEFTMILPGAGVDLGVQIAERVRKSFASYKFTPTLNGQIVDVYKTISVGVAVYDGSIEDADSFIERADYAMYRAKRVGGDRVEIAY